MKRLWYIFGILLVVILAGCGISSEGYKNISSEEAKQLIDNQEVVVLDVRTTEEYQEGHIPSAIWLPLQELETKFSDLDKDQAYLVVCRSGNRSAQASENLSNNQFNTVYNMTGGMNSWSYEIVNE